jgi:hypothetical protein
MNDYYRKHYGQLQGLTVISVRMEDDDEGGEPWPVLIMGRDNGKGGIEDGSHVRVTLSQDPEGNGAGYAFIEGLGV